MGEISIMNILIKMGSIMSDTCIANVLLYENISTILWSDLSTMICPLILIFEKCCLDVSK